MSEEANPLDAVRDLFVYLPVGLAVTAAEEVPKLVAKGRERVGTQVAIARVVGQFAVAKGRQELDRRFRSPEASPKPADRSPAEGARSGDDQADASQAFESKPKVAVEPATLTPASTTAEVLAIPGYDSLSASQVVQRLAGLSGDELVQVGDYEASHRARRTILTRVAQLQER